MSVSTLVLLGLAVVWAIVLLPEGLKRLSSVRNGDSIRSFNHQLTSIGRRGGSVTPTRSLSSPAGPASSSNVIDLRPRDRRPASRPVPAHVRKRRQEVLTVLGASAVLTLLAAVAFGGPFLLLHLLADALLIGYVVLLNQVTQQAPVVRPAAGPALAPRPIRTGPVQDAYGPSIGRVSPVSARRIAN
jgi:hypothetical protein